MSDPQNSLGQLFATLLLASVGLLFLGVQPLLYVAYIEKGLINEASLGTLAAVEISAVAFGSMLGIRLLRSLTTQRIGLVGISLLIIGNLLPDAINLFVTRAVCGSGAGIIVALAAAKIATRSNVNTASGLFLFLQATSQFAILQGLALLAPNASAMLVQLTLAAFAAAACPLLLLIPRSIALEEEKASVSMPPTSGLIGLAISGLFVGSAIVVWAYLGVWLQSMKIAEEETALLLSVALAGQIVGALTAMALGMRWRASLQVAASGGAMMAIIVLLLASQPSSMYGWALIFGFGFVWMFGTPALSGLLLQMDPGRGSLPYAASAQLLGAALIPTFAGELFARHGADKILLSSAVLTGFALVLMGFGLVVKARSKLR